ncbi:MAG: hypothetical protein ACO1RA_21720 [Planctomycetaceae bacterium]
MKWWLGLLVLCVFTGCTRARYRTWADRETQPIIAERIVQPQYDVGRTEVEPAPSSRLHDPFDPDHPPKPTDDPAAATFMQNPGGLRGARNWDKYGTTDELESPLWQSTLKLDESGVAQLDQTSAVELMLLNSREYQTSIEDVYLSALALTLNRFDFALQWFGNTSAAYNHFGSGGAPTETNTLTVPSNIGFTRNLASGGQIVTDFANSFVFEYNNGTKRWGSNLRFSLLQPLLRGASRRVRLEGLTQQERNVLYSVRNFARFRKQLWASTAIQGGGYLDLQLALQTLRNNEANLKRQEETFRLYNETFLAGRSSPLARDQSFQGVLGARLSVIQAEISLQNQLDAYKLRLGIPPSVPIALDDSFLDVFILTDSDLEDLRSQIEDFQRERFAELDAPPTVEALPTHFDTLRAFAVQLPALLTRVSGGLEDWKKRLDRPEPNISQFDKDIHAQTLRTYESLLQQVTTISEEITKAEEAIDEHKQDVTEERRKESWEALVTDINRVLTQLDAIISIQSQTKIYQISLPEIQLTEETSLDFAKQNRLDLQNQLGRVTDSWRKVWVSANALRGGLSVSSTANLATDPTKLHPLDFASDVSSYTVGVQFDGPLNRMAERNAYRASLIAYQREKRNYLALSDTIEQQVRRDLRQLKQLRLNFEISRQSLLVAARQVESARLALISPSAQNTDSLATTTQLFTALSNLVNSRNAFAGNYINYEQQRIQLLLDLEALQLDQRGFPTDDSLQFTNAELNEPRGAEEVPPGVPTPLPDNGDGAANPNAQPLRVAPVIVAPEELPGPQP